MFEFKLPDLGEGIHEAEILEWHVKPGDEIQEDAPLVDVETDKAAVTLPSPRAGTLADAQGQVGDTVFVGQIIAVIDDGSGPTPKPKTQDGDAERKPDGQPAEGKHSEPPKGQHAGPIPAAPATRRLARELGIDLADVPPTGPAGRVLPEDVRRFSTAGPTESPPKSAQREPERADDRAAQDGPSGIPFFDLEPMPDFAQWGPVEVEPLRSIRRKIAKKMTTSLVAVPHVVHMDEADITSITAFQERVRQRDPDRPGLTLLAFVVKACASALKKAPAFNASLDPERQEIITKKYVNIGLAADTPRGLMVPVVMHADQKSLLDLSGEIRELAAAARDGSIGVEALRGGTFTITNIGSLGGVPLAPAINYPEVAILGMGRAKDKPVVSHGEIVVRTMLPITLAFDHRVADGADAARFVSRVVRMLEDLDQFLLEV